MSNLESRIVKLEKAANPTGPAKQFICIYYEDRTAEGFNVQAAQGGEVIHLDTLAELEAFEARPDVDLTIIQIVYASGQPESTITNGDYKTRIGIDAGLL